MNELLDFILSLEAFRKNRLPSLYSDFSIHRRTNPDGYAVNVAAWEQALTKAARAGHIASHGGSSTTSAPHHRKTDHLVLHADQTLLRDLETPEWGRPVALGAVFDEAIRSRSMVPVQVFRTTPGSLRKPQWNLIDPSVLSPWNVMSWGMKQLKGAVGFGSDTSGLQAQELVLVGNLLEAADRIVKKAMGHKPSRTDLIYSRESFVNTFAAVFDGQNEMSDADVDILLLYLSRESGAIAYDGKTIRFRPSNDAPKEITQQDTTVASIKSLMSTMEKQVHGLEKKISELNSTAKLALHNKNRISALSAVRSKKLAEHNLQQRLDTLAQLEQVYSKIEQAADQVEFVQVMEASTGVLRGLNTQVGGAAKVEDVVDELRDEMSKVDEIGNIMNEAGPQIDETEIDDELQELESNERRAQEEAEAEETRKKLAELDSQEQKAKEEARAAASEQVVDAALQDSIGKLSRMSVEEGSGAAAQ
ncbi:Snf7-domain-containing protein [Aspergillus ambiguus]|uniref:putative vacuolar sorting protein SNF7 family protein n=1 Tax=Aspergillus ambiguus TaxID=176160 RepID=UPI003CCCE36D